jgi:hypothetical protein
MLVFGQVKTLSVVMAVVSMDAEIKKLTRFVISFFKDYQLQGDICSI